MLISKDKAFWNKSQFSKKGKSSYLQ